MTTLFDRVCWAHENLEPVRSQYCVVYEDELDKPAKILHPAPEWMAMALHGFLLPPVWVYHSLQLDDGSLVCMEKPRENDTRKIINGYLLHETTPIGPMTEEEAIEYLIKKDVPINVWMNPTNRPKLKICRTNQIPTDRTFRDSWILEDEDG